MVFIWFVRGVRGHMEVKVITTFLAIFAIGGWPAYAQSKTGRQASVSGQEVSRSGLAVRTFSNISGDPSDDWWGIGIAEVVAVALEVVPELEIKRPVLSGEQRDAEDGGQPASGTRWVITGTYQRFEGQIRLT
ncbi:uncharacterized protein METZ01_LOCUS313832, partial [marine metagenome]